MNRLIAVLPLVFACGIGLDARETDTDYLTEEGDVGLSSIEPNWGHPDEDTIVTLTGWGLNGEVSVQFGNADLQVTRIDEDRVVVTAPAIGFETAIDVKIVSGSGAFTEAEGFRYSYDQPQDTDTDTETDTDDTETTQPTGEYGGLVHFIRAQVACKDCFGVTNELTIDASAAFHDASSQGYLDWQPPSGSCAMNAAPSDMNLNRRDVGPWVYLNSGATSVGLAKTNSSSGVMYSATNLGLADFISNASYDVSVPDGGELGGGFEVKNAVVTPQGFTDIQPFELLLVNIAAAFSAPVSASGTNFSWAPSGGTGSFMIQVDVYDPSGANLLGNVVCLGPDNGTMYIPGGYFGGYPYGSLLAVKMYRQRVTENVIPTTGDTLLAVTHGGVWGTAYLSY